MSVIKISLAQYRQPHTRHLYANHQIQYFQVGDFVHISSDIDIKDYNNYCDSMKINLNIGKQYFLMVSNNPYPYGNMSGNALGYSMWVDLNNDTIFSEAELIFCRYDGFDIYSYSDSIKFTDTLLTGTHRLRLRAEWGTAPDSPYDTLWGGETEDYLINFNNSSVDVNDMSSQQRAFVYPIPIKENFKIDLGAHYKTITVEVTNICGGLIFRNEYACKSLLNLSLPVPAGLYIVNVTHDGNRSVFKLIKD
jgi:hypothetical protein